MRRLKLEKVADHAGDERLHGKPALEGDKALKGATDALNGDEKVLWGDGEAVNGDVKAVMGDGKVEEEEKRKVYSTNDTN